MRARDGAPGDWRQRRRLQALRLSHLGWLQRDIAEASNVSEVSVSHWLSRARVGGPQALLTHHPTGRPPALTQEQLSRIPEFLWHGPEAYGFRGKVWTCARVARVIEEELGVAYDKGHVSRLLKQLRW